MPAGIPMQTIIIPVDANYLKILRSGGQRTVVGNFLKPASYSYLKNQCSLRIPDVPAGIIL